MKNPPCVLGLLSDSHGDVQATRRAAMQLVNAGATHLVHLGDLCGEPVVDALAGWTTPAGAPIAVHMVWGNCDAGTAADTRYAQALGITVYDKLGWLSLQDKRIALTHGHVANAIEEAVRGRADFLLHGHLHRRLDSVGGGSEHPCRMICAGSVASPRDGLPPVAALLTPDDGLLQWIQVSR